MKVFVFTIDQRKSREGHDRVPEMLESLADLTVLRAFERTAGDEFQGLVTDSGAAITLIGRLLRDDQWNIGIGPASIEEPIPSDARAGRGEAYLAARNAVTAAKSSPWNLRVVGEDQYACRQFETVLWLWAAVLSRRTTGGWELADLVEQGFTYERSARELGITQSAVSQRARAAALIEDRRARELATQLAADLLAPSTETETGMEVPS